MNTKLLRQKILDLAIRGKLVPQDPNDEPASVLLEKIRAEKERLIKEKKIKSDKSKNTADRSNYRNLFNIPDNWVWVKLGEIGNWQSGATPSRSNKEYFNGEILWLKTGDLNDGYVYDIPEKITEKALNETSLKINPIGSVLIAMYGATIGKVGILTKPATTNQACCACSNFRQIYNLYLFYLLIAYRDYFIGISEGGAQPNISKTKIISTYIPLPPLNEQIRIVQEVEKLFELINIIEDNKFSLQQYIIQAKSKVLDLAIRGKLVAQDPNDEPASVLLERIGKGKKVTSDKTNYPFEVPSSWTWIELNNVLEYEQPTKYRVKSTEYSNDFSIPVLTAGKSFIIGYTDEKDGVFTDLPVIIFDDFTTSSQYVDFEFKVKSSAMKILRAKKEIADTKYIAFFMSITRLTGNTHKRYWISEYSKIKIPLPPLAEQKRIVSQIETIFAQLDIIADSLKE
ncbi:MAG TPA: restriction endonuclease subunit S [Bacteroidales bacterium]|nr:restriction endonuclease subunit S [Bacteroidales bacterium]